MQTDFVLKILCAIKKIKNMEIRERNEKIVRFAFVYTYLVRTPGKITCDLF